MGEIYSRAEEALLLQHKTGKSTALTRSTEGLGGMDTEGGREKPSTGGGKQLAGNTGAAAANARASPATSSAATTTAVHILPTLPSLLLLMLLQLLLVLAQ